MRLGAFMKALRLARKPRELLRTVAFHLTGQKTMRQDETVMSRIVWRFFFGNKIVPILGRYTHFGAGGVETIFKNLGMTERQGYFVEAGAYDGVASSNTKFLELYCGWTGLLVEPEPQSARLASYHRRSPVIRAALVPSTYVGDYVELEYSGLMTTADIGTNAEAARRQAEEGAAFLRPFEHRDRFSARALTLSEALKQVDAPNRIDLISLDLEGIELDVLAGFNFKEYQVRYFLIESRSDEAALEFFAIHGYSLKMTIFPVGLLFSRN